MKFKSDRSQGDLNGYLGAGSHIQGELRFDDTFRVDGRLTGRVDSKGDLVVGEHGEIEGDVKAGCVYVSGTVRGSIKADTRVEITAQGKVWADLETPSLVIEDGAFFQGQCSMVKVSVAGERSRPTGVVARLPLTKES